MAPFNRRWAPTRWLWLVALTLTACTGLDFGGDDGTGEPTQMECTTELRPYFDGEGCCGEPVGEPLCYTGQIAFCEVRDARHEPIRCYYKHNGVKLRCGSCRNTNDCVAESVRVCAA
ncbi:hypothetical protein [Archangium lipolyticum]|uniref:hypothetical protein n=1 Tax=Archangium lipolyticum TaxID=2970465 RepID=UPI00214A065D|nr:hypothetical protein [Archangium lipolyticum]